LSLQDAQDIKIFEAARVENTVIMTKDSGFIDLVCRDRRLMGELFNSHWFEVLAYAVAVIIMGLNAWLLLQTFWGWLYPDS
jgi:Mn2+/Fe2+ NRAMP family transporter